MMANVLESNEVSDFLSQNFSETLNSFPEKLSAYKKTARELFSRLGIPTTRHEEWKYTRVKPFFNKPFSAPIEPSASEIEKIVNKNALKKESIKLVILNGRIFSSDKKSGIHILSGTEAINKALSIGLFNGEVREEAFHALNTAMFQDMLYLNMPKGEAKEFVEIFMISSPGANPSISFPRIHIHAEKFSSSEILFHHLSLNEQPSVTVSLTQVHLEEQSHLHLYKIQEENNASALIDIQISSQDAGSNCSVYTTSLSGALVRNNLDIRLEGRSAEAHMYGAYFVSGSSLTDNHTFADHAVPHCQSNELYKGIIADKGTAVFNGKILVRPDAQKTNAYQSSSNILLSDDAHVFTKPQLEIFADDVKCSHGATTGHLDDTSLFYLRSRGIGEDKARNMLMFAFIGDVIEKIPDQGLREKLLEKISLKFSQH